MMTSLSEQECLQMLATTTVGRIGFLADDRVQVIPVNFLLDGRDVVVRTAPDGPLSTLRSSPVLVAFEVDHHEALAATGWSVLLNGRVSTMSEQQLESIPGSSTRLPWAEGDRSLVLRLTPESISGRRVHRAR
jgi:nitroimidazol reductase NimA-like FMN-containing flavoprotein (pyridoxamine 5'-phosphate oxidase superfamily)